MPLKIRCPHCQKILLAEDETAGQRKLCPACAQPFDVPLPVETVPESPTDVASKCPHCGADVAPGTSVCPKCHTDVATGKRLPPLQRLRRMSMKTWSVAGLLVISAVLVGYVSFSLVRAYRQRPIGTALSPPAGESLSHAVDEWAGRLLRSTSDAERQAARDRLLHAGARAGQLAVGTVSQALEESLADGGQDLVAQRNRRVALEVLGQVAPGDGTSLDRVLPVLEACAQDPVLQPAVWRTRGCLGDRAALEELRRLWLAELRRLMFLRRLAELTDAADDGPLDTLLREAGSEAKRTAASLARLKETDEVGVLDALLTSYWESWGWLGQGRGSGLAAELFELAKPGVAEPVGEAGFEATKQAIRGARDVLEKMGQRGTPEARAVAGLVLTQCAGQYRSARERIVASLATVLPDCEPSTQQRLTWAIARLTGRTFGQATGRSLPEEISRSDVAAVLRWAQSTGGAPPAELAPAAAYAPPPSLAYRVVPPIRQLERDLLERLAGGWASAGAALVEWRAAGLGCTPRLLKHLDPGQRQPAYPALAAALVLVAKNNERSVRRELTLWREATDQPVWVRQLAYAVLGALDARTGRWESGWPAGFEMPAREVLESGQPGWEHFGCVLAAGGQAMRARLETFQPAPLSAATRARLLEVARRCEQDDPR